MKQISAIAHSSWRYIIGWKDRILFGSAEITNVFVNFISSTLGISAGVQLLVIYAPGFIWTNLENKNSGITLNFDTNTVFTIIGALLAVFSFISLVSELFEAIGLRRYKLHIQPLGPAADNILKDAYQGSEDTILELNGQGLLTNRNVNLQLGSSNNPLWTKPEHFALPQPIDRHKSNLLLKAPGVKLDTANGKKIRLATSINLQALQNGTTINVQQARYFHDRLSNNLARSVITYKRFPFIEPIRWNTDTNGQLLTFEESPFSNQLGGSCIVITADSKIAYVQQGGGADENAQRLAPSGSGSFDWSDIGKTETIQGLAKRGIEREVEEEIDVKVTPENSLHFLTGFGRYLYRGGKPEFFSLIFYKGSLDGSINLSVRPEEWDYIDTRIRFHTLDGNPFAAKARLVSSLERFEEKIMSDRNTSGPLYFATRLAIEYVKSRKFAIADVREFFLRK